MVKNKDLKKRNFQLIRLQIFRQNLNPPSLTLREGKKNCHPEFFAEKYRRVN